MNRALRVIAAVGLAGLAGCATHKKLVDPAVSFHQAGLCDEQRAEQIRQKLTDRTIADWLEADVQPRLPTPLAVAKLVPSGRWDQQYPSQYKLEAIDNEEMDGWRKAVSQAKRIEAVRPLPRMLAAGSCVGLKDLRHAAARMGCELLLVYARADSHVDNFTDAAVLYWTAVGLWLVPANVGEHKTVYQAALLDTRTGAVLAAATGSEHLQKHYPAAFEGNRRHEMTRQARGDALIELQREFAHTAERIGG